MNPMKKTKIIRKIEPDEIQVNEVPEGKYVDEREIMSLKKYIITYGYEMPGGNLVPKTYLLVPIKIDKEKGLLKGLKFDDEGRLKFRSLKINNISSVYLAEY